MNQQFSREIARDRRPRLNSVSVPVIFDRDEPMTTTVQPGDRLRKLDGFKMFQEFQHGSEWFTIWL